MAIDENLLGKARNSPHDLRFEEALKLAKQLGFVEVRSTGSHRIFHHPAGGKIPSPPRPLNLQEGKNGRAKAYQVRQMLTMAEAMGIIRRDGE